LFTFDYSEGYIQVSMWVYFLFPFSNIVSCGYIFCFHLAILYHHVTGNGGIANFALILSTNQTYTYLFVSLDYSLNTIYLKFRA